MSFYDATVPAYLQVLGSLSGLLTKAEAHCKAKNIQPEVLLGSRLYPDMLPLSKQIQLASDFATRGCARVTHSDVPQTPDTEKTFEELRARLAKTADYVKSFKPAQFEGAEERTITWQTRTSTKNMPGTPYLFHHVLPNVFFHVTTAYDILRQSGLEIGKQDYLGKP